MQRLATKRAAVRGCREPVGESVERKREFYLVHRLGDSAAFTVSPGVARAVCGSAEAAGLTPEVALVVMAGFFRRRQS
jgi:hypothetical protein